MKTYLKKLEELISFQKESGKGINPKLLPLTQEVESKEEAIERMAECIYKMVTKQ
jgi:hypothetical protein